MSLAEQTVFIESIALWEVVRKSQIICYVCLLLLATVIKERGVLRQAEAEGTLTILR